MDGVDKGDQIIGYHRVIRQTIRYWKTILYHWMEMALADANILFLEEVGIMVEAQHCESIV